MVNTFGRAVGAPAPFDPKGATIEGLPAVQRGAGQDSEALFQVGSELAGVFGRTADRQARIEGKREGEIAGNGPAFRPTGSTSLKGHAYDDAGVATYLDRLDATVSRRTREAFQAWSQDPNRTTGGLTETLDGVRDDVLANDTFAEVRGRVAAQFERLRTPFEIQAQKDAFDRVQDGRRRAGFEKLNESQTTTQRVIALDPDNPKAQAAVATQLQSQIDTIEALARNGDITQEQAAKQIASVKQATMMQIGEARIGKMKDTAAIDASEQALERDFAAGKLKNLDAGGYEKLKAAHVQRRQQINAQGSRDASLITDRLKSVVDREKQGFAVPQAEIEDLRMTAGRTPQGQAAFDIAERKRQLAQNLRGQTPEGIDAFGRMMRDQMRVSGAVSGPQNELVSFVDELATERRKAIETAPLRDADRQGVIKVAPFDFSNTEQLETGMARRVAEAQAVAKHNQREPVYLDPDEVARAKSVIAQGGDQAIESLKRVIAGAGNAAPAVLAEIGNGAPELAHAGALLVNGIPQQREVARDIIEGRRVKGVPGANIPEIDAATDNEAFAKVFGKSLTHQPEDSERLRASARAVFTARAMRGGVLKGTQEASDLLEQVYREVGGQVKVRGADYGGPETYKPSWYKDASTTMLPQYIKRGRFPDVIGAITDLDLKELPGGGPVDKDGAPVKASVLQGYYPVAVRGGYQFAKKSDYHDERLFLRGSDGGRFTLDLDRLSVRLRPRVPDAFLGGR